MSLEPQQQYELRYGEATADPWHSQWGRLLRALSLVSVVWRDGVKDPLHPLQRVLSAQQRHIELTGQKGKNMSDGLYHPGWWEVDGKRARWTCCYAGFKEFGSRELARRNAKRVTGCCERRVLRETTLPETPDLSESRWYPTLPCGRREGTVVPPRDRRSKLQRNELCELMFRDAGYDPSKYPLYPAY